MRIRPVLLASVSFLVLSSLCGRALAYDVPPNDGLVTENLDAGVTVLSPEEKRSLQEDLLAYERATSNQIALVIVQSLHGTPIEDAGLEIGRTWGVGTTNNNGILILFSYDDREVRIDAGYGLEGAVPDIVAAGIIRTDMIPAFRDARYFDGFSAAIESLKKHIGGEYTADRYAEAESGSSGMGIFFAFILFQWLLAVLGRTKSWWLGGVLGGIGGFALAILYGWWLAVPILVPLGLFLDYVVSANYHRRGGTRWWAGGDWGPGGGGSGGSGGFGGFGGGSFGGGGASGRW